MPTIHLSNWSSFRTPNAHGPGRKWTIMARPRRWEHGEGTVNMLVPSGNDLIILQDGLLTLEEYRHRYISNILSRVWAGHQLTPGDLKAVTPLDPVPVAEGDTLLCACSVANAKAGMCHRAWAAGLLKLAGWDVVLDGESVSTEQAKALTYRIV